MLLVLFFTTIPIATLVSVTTLALTGTRLTSFAVFTLLLSFTILRKTFCYNLSLAVQIASDGKVALDRIQTFLTEKVAKFEGIGEHHTQNRDEQLAHNSKIKKESEVAVQLVSYLKRGDHLGETQMGTPNTLSEAFTDQVTSEIYSCNSVFKKPYVTVSKASCSWNQNILSDTLRDITFSVCNGDLLAITGAVGSGKSSLLTAILGELPLRTGTISCHGKLAYVPQIPWVFSGTVRENILFGLPYNEERFQHVVHICDLTKDLASFTSGDLTEIGQRGVTLSGGQKARVGLARAVYSDADIYLLDDPLSAVDTKVGRKLFENCVLGHLSGRIRLLATHQLQYLKDVARIIVMENGLVSHEGVYTETLNQPALVEVEGFSEPCEDEPSLAESVSLEECNDKDIIEGEQKGPSLSSFSVVQGNVEGKGEDALDLPTNQRTSQIACSLTLPSTWDKHKADQLQNHDVKLAEPLEQSIAPNRSSDPGRNINKQQHSASVPMDTCAELSTQGKENEAFVGEDNECFALNVQEKVSVEQELSESIDNDPGVLDSVNGDVSILTDSFTAEEPRGRDNEAFVEDSNLPKWERESDGVNVNKETIVQATCSPVVSSICEVSNGDSGQRSTLDLKEDEETKSAGTVTWRLYWNYFKEGLPVFRILLLALVLVLAQGKAISIT